ncbi:MAG TPA: hypothetical protein VHK91_02690 [Flavisolibacter sp.]|jgi:hypothetical protein|nr:hypothetical protein [Flavisolibacter sp.]
MKGMYALEGGLAGAVALTLISETVKRAIPHAPRVDLLGMNALSKGLKIIGARKPEDRKLYTWALAGDLISNAAYYSIAGIGKKDNALLRGAALGFGAGLGAVLLPKPLGLKDHYTDRTLSTRVLTVGLYVAGGIIAAAVMKWADKKKQRSNQDWEQRLMTSSMA